MANKSLFAGLKSRFARATARNEAGGRAYALAPKHALAQLAATGCFNGTFYAQSDEQLQTLCALIAQVNDNRYLAKLALYSRERAFMKDMPAALLLALTTREPALMQTVFDRVVEYPLAVVLACLVSPGLGAVGVPRGLKGWLGQLLLVLGGRRRCAIRARPADARRHQGAGGRGRPQAAQSARRQRHRFGG